METSTQAHSGPPNAATLAHWEKRGAWSPVSLDSETRIAVDTATAAYHLNRRPQTLRIWALTGHPITPRRVNGRLAWAVSDLKTLLGVPQ